MKRSLMKSPASVSVIYSDGSYSNNLRGGNFEAEESENSICVYIDLSRNLRVRNKNENSYSDAHELLERHSELKSLQVFVEEAVDALNSFSRRVPEGAIELELAAREGQPFRYSVVQWRKSNGSVFFDLRPS